MPYEFDPTAQAIVAAYPGGAPLAVVAEALGLTPQAIAYIETQALAAMRRRLVLVGIDATVLADLDAAAPGGVWSDLDQIADSEGT